MTDKLTPIVSLHLYKGGYVYKKRSIKSKDNLFMTVLTIQSRFDKSPQRFKANWCKNMIKLWVLALRF